MRSGQSGHSWLGEPGTALAAIIMIGFPFIGAFGLQFLVYLGALLNISVDICESARLDGIKWWQNIIYIELPLLKPQMKMFVMLAIINSMQSFENILVLTEGGPGKVRLYRHFICISRLLRIVIWGMPLPRVLLFLLVLLFTVLNYKFVNTQD
ncbi:MAG: carbohydrate ABC transporter permease [Eisenbergiella sp.]